MVVFRILSAIRIARGASGSLSSVGQKHPSSTQPISIDVENALRESVILTPSTSRRSSRKALATLALVAIAHLHCAAPSYAVDLPEKPVCAGQEEVFSILQKQSADLGSMRFQLSELLRVVETMRLRMDEEAGRRATHNQSDTSVRETRQ